MAPRIHIDLPLAAGIALELPAAQARHLQVLRMQPGDALTLFNGAGGEWSARIARMGRGTVGVVLETHLDVDRELARPVTIAIGMPANERMDALVEKATELGVAAIRPLLCDRSVLRLSGERAARRLEHWQGVAIAASEQCGRTRVPQVHAVQSLRSWLDDEAAAAPGEVRRFVLSVGAVPGWHASLAGPEGTAFVVLSGPEGGFTVAEEEAARGTGFVAVSLGVRILRADTAPLAMLAWCALESATGRAA